MRSHKFIAALVVAAGLAAPAFVASPASATARTCRVDVFTVYAGNVSERDGRDELRFLVDGNLFPKINENHVPVFSGDTVTGTAFEKPTTLLVSSSDVAEFSLREVSLPFPGAGVGLGTARAFGWQCADVRIGDPKVLPAETFTGSRPTDYQYRVRLMLSALS